MAGVMSVVEHHRHEEHEQILAFLLLCRHNHSGTARVGKLKDDVGRFHRVEYVKQECPFESDFHVVAGIVTQDVLLCGGGVIDVLGGDGQVLANTIVRRRAPIIASLSTVTWNGLSVGITLL